MSILEWWRKLVSGEPHFVIGDRDRPYLLRWYLVPRNQWLNLYLHKFVRDDEDRALHDHPWWFASLMIKGRYLEVTSQGDGWNCGVLRKAISIAIRPATHRHRVVLMKGCDGTPIPCWTVILTGPNRREWGFWCPKGFVPWHVFVDQKDRGLVGRGCE